MREPAETATPLTAAEEKAYTFIRLYLERHGASPSVREVGEHLGLSSPNNANRVLRRLEARGYIRRVPAPPGRPRTPVSADLSIPLRGAVSCGVPAEPEDADDRLDLRALFGRDDLAAFVAVGESMIDSHIAPGDYVVVREQPEPETGQTVVALVGGEMLCKKFRRGRGRKVRLEACNGSVPPLELDPAATELRILGVLHGVIRKV